MGHIQPGKPIENANIESFHGRLRDECLNVSWSWNVFAARRKISAWQQDYNCQRPHSSLSYKTPEQFAQQCRAASPSCSFDRAEEQPPQGNPAGLLRSALTRLPLGSERILQEGEAEKEISDDSYTQPDEEGVRSQQSAASAVTRAMEFVNRRHGYRLTRGLLGAGRRSSFCACWLTFLGTADKKTAGRS